MAPASTAVRSMASLVSLLLAVSMASAQSVQPSNASLPLSESGSEYVLSFTGGPIPTTQTYNIAPLTAEVGKGGDLTLLQTIIIPGNFKQVDYTNMNSVTHGDIAYISCDPNGSNIDPSTVVSTVGEPATKPAAILLYSLTSQECTLNGSFSYTTLFTTTSLKDSASLMTYLANYPPAATDLLSANIAVNSTSNNSSSSPSATANSGGPAPTTAVAMSILYSITGIITLLFLVIIATGAVRAHRHPERYGPRTAISGRPRQSRAKGLARAMLETLPIVKFGDPETTATKANTQDVELGETHMASETTRNVTTTSGGNGEQEDDEDAKSHKPEATVIESGLGPAEDSVHSHDHAHDDHEGHGHEGHDHSKKETTAATEEEGHLGCSICTDDFCTGEDVRVLPCNHKFHPACVDPWLLNVSGTCPLCRHDLRPKEEEPSETAEGEEDATAELPPPLAMPEESSVAAESEAGSQHRSRAARLLDIHRLRHAPADERIAALRELREQTQNQGETAEGEADAEEPSRRLRLTGRLRDAFKIKTRTQDTPAQ